MDCQTAAANKPDIHLTCVECKSKDICFIRSFVWFTRILIVLQQYWYTLVPVQTQGTLPTHEAVACQISLHLNLQVSEKVSQAFNFLLQTDQITEEQQCFLLITPRFVPTISTSLSGWVHLLPPFHSPSLHSNQLTILLRVPPLQYGFGLHAGTCRGLSPCPTQIDQQC